MSLPAPETSFVDSLSAPVAPRRIGFAPTLGGIAPVDPEVRAICEQSLGHFRTLGADIDDACPDFSDGREVFQRLRAASFAMRMKPLLDRHRDLLKPDVVWNVEKGLAMTVHDLGWAERARGALYHSVDAFFSTHELLISPTVMVPPFSHEKKWVDKVDNTVFDNYVDWMMLTSVLTLTACPSISIPCGFTASGLPVGLQLLGPPRGEAALLQAAALFEQEAGIVNRLPIDPITK